MNYRWVTNIHKSEFDSSRVRGIDLEKDWQVGKWAGNPRATESCTVEELEQQGYIGLYEYTEEISCER